MSNKRKVVSDIHERFSLYDLNGSFDDVIDKIERIKKRSADLGLKNARLEVVSKKYEEGNDLAVVFDRLETDDEFKERLAQEKRSAEWRRSEYERLKKEFEKS